MPCETTRRRGTPTYLAALLTLTLCLFAPTGAHAQSTDTPTMGWSTWSFMRGGPTLQSVEAQALALKTSGLAALGYDYVNVDDYWYICGSPQGPQVDGFGHWMVDPGKFPSDPSTGQNGIQVLANYVHSLGLKLGLYVTPGIPNQALMANTPVQGTPYHANDIALPKTAPGYTPEVNYNACGAPPPYTQKSAPAAPLNYATPGAQAFINSWADEFASWGVDDLKLDGVTNDQPDIRAWSTALRQSGRPIRLQLSNDLNIVNGYKNRQQASAWRTGGDIEPYPPGKTLTDWAKVATRFDAVGEWQPFGGAGAYNDYDSIELGNGDTDGLTVPERQSQLSLWALGSSPLILGTDLTHLDPGDLSLLKNPRVISVDQDGVDASRIVDASNQQVFAKTEWDGRVVLGLFNASGTTPAKVRVNLADAGITAPSTSARDLWTGKLIRLRGTYSTQLGPGAVQLLQTAPQAGVGQIQLLAWQSPAKLSASAKVDTCPPTTSTSAATTPPHAAEARGPCAFAGGRVVTGIGGRWRGAVTLRGINVGWNGPYRLNMGYAVKGRARFEISVDNAKPETVTLSGTSTTAPDTASTQVQLRGGDNTIRFYNAHGQAPELDNVTLLPLAPKSEPKTPRLGTLFNLPKPPKRHPKR
ncbi:MAG: alpha-galactosidase [Solirubrobacterales bacterium]|nr:alpha-galactosidase [Solirubrobacterales bacterium]